jgi:hypothetical protein
MDSDGSNSLKVPPQIYSAEYIDFDWQIRKNGDFILESYSPLGQTIFKVFYEKKIHSISLSGNVPLSIESLSVGDEGFLYYKNMKSPIKLEEMICLFEFKWPRFWLDQVIRYSASSNEVLIEFADKDRLWKLNGERLNGHSWTWRGTIFWYSFWGLKRHSMVIDMITSDKLKVFLEDGRDAWVTMEKRED